MRLFVSTPRLACIMEITRDVTPQLLEIDVNKKTFFFYVLHVRALKNVLYLYDEPTSAHQKIFYSCYKTP
jgi:hypothetical protein